MGASIGYLANGYSNLDPGSDFRPTAERNPIELCYFPPAGSCIVYR